MATVLIREVACCLHNRFPMMIKRAAFIFRTSRPRYLTTYKYIVVATSMQCCNGQEIPTPHQQQEVHVEQNCNATALNR